ncbi:hypothetical protein IAT40_004505 [Kwoniella sp. CBS 6097]
MICQQPKHPLSPARYIMNSSSLVTHSSADGDLPSDYTVYTANTSFSPQTRNPVTTSAASSQDASSMVSADVITTKQSVASDSENTGSSHLEAISQAALIDHAVSSSTREQAPSDPRSPFTATVLSPGLPQAVLRESVLINDDEEVVVVEKAQMVRLTDLRQPTLVTGRSSSAATSQATLGSDENSESPVMENPIDLSSPFDPRSANKPWGIDEGLDESQDPPGGYRATSLSDSEALDDRSQGIDSSIRHEDLDILSPGSDSRNISHFESHSATGPVMSFQKAKVLPCEAYPPSSMSVTGGGTDRHNDCDRARNFTGISGEVDTTNLVSGYETFYTERKDNPFPKPLKIHASECSSVNGTGRVRQAVHSCASKARSALSSISERLGRFQFSRRPASKELAHFSNRSAVPPPWFDLEDDGTFCNDASALETVANSTPYLHSEHYDPGSLIYAVQPGQAYTAESRRG